MSEFLGVIRIGPRGLSRLPSEMFYFVAIFWLRSFAIIVGFFEQSIHLVEHPIDGPLEL